MDLLLQQIGNGLALGALYALFGLGFGLVFSTLGILNVAHGTFATWGALFCVWLVIHFNVPFVVALVVGLVGAGLIGVIVDEVAFQPLRSRPEFVIPTLITSIAALIILEGLARLATDAQALRFPAGSVPGGGFDIGTVRLSWSQAIALVALVVVGLALYLLLTRTRFGLAMRAVGHDPDAASLGGVDPRTVTRVTAFLAAGAAGLAGILLALSTNNITFLMGAGLLLKGFAAVVVGGVGDVRGTVLAGLFLGVAEVLTGEYVGATYQDMVSFGLLIVFLVVRPQGIFKSNITVERA